MRFLALLAALLLASCGLPGTGPAQWTEMPPGKQATEAAAASEPAAAPHEASVEAAAAPAEPAGQPQPDVEVLRAVSLSSAQLLAVQTGLRDALRDETVRVDRVTAGESSLGVIYVCGYAAGGAEGGEGPAFRGVLMGKDSTQPKFVPVKSTGGDQHAAAQVCEAQGIPLSAAKVAVVANPPAAEESLPGSTADAAGEVAAAAPEAAGAGTSAEIVAPSGPLPKVVLTAPQINAVQAGVRTALEAPSAVFGRMLAGADAKGGIVVCGFVSPLEGAGAGIQPFTGVLIGEGDRRNFVPVGFGRDEMEKRQTMQVCASQGISL